MFQNIDIELDITEENIKSENKRKQIFWIDNVVDIIMKNYLYERHSLYGMGKEPIPYSELKLLQKAKQFSK